MGDGTQNRTALLRILAKRPVRKRMKCWPYNIWVCAFCPEDIRPRQFYRAANDVRCHDSCFEQYYQTENFGRMKPGSKALLTMATSRDIQ